MRHIATAIAVTLLLVCPVHADDAVKFLYQPGRVPVGHAYHFLKTSLDGTSPQSLWVFVAAEDRIESWTAASSLRPARHVTAWMDWLTCGTSALAIDDVRTASDPVHIVSLVDGIDDRSFVATRDGPPKISQRVDLHWRPWHLYDADLLSLMMTLPHLVAARDTFQIDLASAVDSTTTSFRDRGLVKFSYRRDQVVGEERCALYEVDGEGLDHRGGTIAVRASDGMVQEIALGLPNDPVHSGLRLELDRSTHMTQSSWNRIVRKTR